MPRSLRARCLPDSIREFRAAARERFQDGVTAAAGERRTAALYLWGYAAEMTLKAAYFALLGFAETRTITPADLRAAVAAGQALGVPWPAGGQGHNLRAWAQLIVTVRAATPALAYANPGFGLEIMDRGQRLGRLWAETLRYHKNVAYAHEVRQVRQAVEWLLAHSRVL
jgi:hypothetical protein